MSFVTTETFAFWLEGPTDFFENYVSGFFVDAIGEAESVEVFGRVDAQIDAREFEATTAPAAGRSRAPHFVSRISWSDRRNRGSTVDSMGSRDALRTRCMR